jgi:hypothetical protein
MLNLLPEQEKYFIKKEYKNRRSVVAWALLFCTLMIALISLLPSYVLSTQKRDEESLKVASFAKSSALEESKNLSAEILLANKKINALKPDNYIYTNEIFDDILSGQVVGVKVLRFSIARKNTERIDVVVGGVAEKRESLLLFQKNLKKIDRFIEVVLPVSDLVKDSDINFSIKITVKI